MYKQRYYPKLSQKKSTSWENVSNWYDQLVGKQGHYFHQHVIIPGVLKLLNLKAGNSVVDLACGQGILSRQLPKGVAYMGIDSSQSLVEAAKHQAKSGHNFITADVTKSLNISSHQLINSLTKQPISFSHATIILALQNIQHPQLVFQNVAKLLDQTGSFVIVLNHPYFRIPRQSGWGTNEQTKLQYRWINRYMSPLKIPIKAHPGKSQSAITWSFHYPLSSYIAWLNNNGFVIETLEEWTSDKTSVGTTAKMENRARDEFPLFMAIKAKKL